jgi:serine/threonine-protein kinase
VNRLFRWGILIALAVLIGSGLVAIKLIFVEDKDAEVPSLVGLSVVEATNRLQAAGLLARIDQIDSDQPEGRVVAQDIPVGAKAARGNIVNLKSSRGGTLIRVPDIRGMEFAEAAKMLDASGLKIGNTLRVPDQLKPAGTVIAQNPAAPASVLNSRMIELLVSEGKAGRAETVQVPDLKGQEESMARQIVEQSDLAVSRVIYLESGLVPAGAVLRTQPNAGSRVQFGASVILYVAKAPQEATREEAAVPASNTNEARPLPPPPRTQPDGTVPPVLPVDEIVTQPAQEVKTVPVIPEQTRSQPVAATSTVAPVPAAQKTARIRYQVPPLTRPLSLKIEITDGSGVRMLRDQQTNGGEYITIEAPYDGAARVTVNLGGEIVWQERYN